MSDAWKDRVVDAVVADGEQSSADAVNANTDEQFLSYGFLQWTQRSGELGKMLRRASTSFPLDFARTFGPSANRVVEVATSGQDIAVDGASLYEEPWLSRFRAAGRQPWMVAVQRNHALSGFHWSQAMKAAEILGATTERELALVFDRAVVAPGRVPASARAAVAANPSLRGLQLAAAFFGVELSNVSERWREQHAARLDRLLANKRIGDVAVTQWGSA
jgi:hypothetical protein